MSKALTEIQDRDLKIELESRLQNALILFPHQLVSHKNPGEKAEARGLDNAGKLVLIEVALKNGRDLILISELGANDEFQDTLVKPVSLHKTGTDVLLYGEIYPDGSPIQINIRKIAFLKKIRGSHIKTLPAE